MDSRKSKVDSRRIKVDSRRRKIDSRNRKVDSRSRKMGWGRKKMDSRRRKMDSRRSKVDSSGIKQGRWTPFNGLGDEIFCLSYFLGIQFDFCFPSSLYPISFVTPPGQPQLIHTKFVLWLQAVVIVKDCGCFTNATKKPTR